MIDHTPIDENDALFAVDCIAAMKYFPRDNGYIKGILANSLLRLVNTRDNQPLIGLNDEPIPFGPKERLRRFVERFVFATGGWPGPGDMEAFYVLMFPAGDGKPRGLCGISGHTWEENLDELSTPLIDRAPDPLLLGPGPGDEPIGDLLRAMDVAAAAKIQPRDGGAPDEL